jgi:hypothetical protein
MVDHGDFVVNNIRICFIAVDPFPENGLIVEVEGKTGGVGYAREDIGDIWKSRGSVK